MKTIVIYRLDRLLSRRKFLIAQTAQMEAARVWNLCMETHKQARQAHGNWPGANELHQLTKGRFALNA